MENNTEAHSPLTHMMKEIMASDFEKKMEHREQRQQYNVDDLLKVAHRILAMTEQERIDYVAHLNEHTVKIHIGDAR